VEYTCDEIAVRLAEQGRVSVPGFGVFEVKVRKARTARNPRTGGKVAVPERLVVTFRPSPELNRVVSEAREPEGKPPVGEESARPRRRWWFW
jgi:nucleoid DNA-binding protein